MAAKKRPVIQRDELNLTLAQIDRVRAVVDQTDPDDAKLLLDMLEAETEAHSLAERLLLEFHTESAEVEAIDAALARFTKPLEARKAAAKRRIANRRSMLFSLARAVDVTPFRTTFGTISHCEASPRAVVRDVTALPQGFFDRRPIMSAITDALKAGEDVPGAVLETNAEGVWKIIT